MVCNGSASSAAASAAWVYCLSGREPVDRRDVV